MKGISVNYWNVYKVLISVWRGRCDYSPWAPKTLALPLLQIKLRYIPEGYILYVRMELIKLHRRIT